MNKIFHTQWLHVSSHEKTMCDPGMANAHIFDKQMENTLLIYSRANDVAGALFNGPARHAKKSSTVASITSGLLPDATDCQ